LLIKVGFILSYSIGTATNQSELGVNQEEESNENDDRCSQLVVTHTSNEDEGTQRQSTPIATSITQELYESCNSY
jgi:hypothetical protein